MNDSTSTASIDHSVWDDFLLKYHHQNPYGDGDSAARIVRILESVPLGEELLLKRARTVAETPLASA